MFGMFTAYSFLWTDYNSSPPILSSLSQAYFPVFSMKFSGPCYSTQKYRPSFVLLAVTSFCFFSKFVFFLYIPALPPIRILSTCISYIFKFLLHPQKSRKTPVTVLQRYYVIDAAVGVDIYSYSS